MRNPCRMAPVFLALLVVGTGGLVFAQDGVVLQPDIPGGTNDYRVTILVSNEADEAPLVDPNLRNAWGIVHSPTGPWWVANNATGTSTIYDGDGNPAGPQLITVPGAPTGTVFNASGSFQMAQGQPAIFLFASEDGTFSAWNPNVNPNAVVVHSENGAIYKGLAIHNARLYSTDFGSCSVDTFHGNFFDGTFDEIDTPGGFPPVGVPDGYCPFGIKAIDDSVYVTYAKKNGVDEEHGVGLGVVRQFDTDGNFVARVASHGPLNAPWGIAKAPDDFGRFSGCVLIGNFGDGKLTGWCPTNHGVHPYRFGGFLQEKNAAIVIDGLWGIGFGNGHLAGPRNVLFFAAGPDEEVNGYFGKIVLHPAD